MPYILYTCLCSCVLVLFRCLLFFRLDPSPSRRVFTLVCSVRYMSFFAGDGINMRVPDVSHHHIPDLILFSRPLAPGTVSSTFRAHSFTIFWGEFKSNLGNRQHKQIARGSVLLGFPGRVSTPFETHVAEGNAAADPSLSTTMSVVLFGSLATPALTCEGVVGVLSR